jgi:hypothetical protein
MGGSTKSLKSLSKYHITPAADSPAADSILKKEKSDVAKERNDNRTYSE